MANDLTKSKSAEVLRSECPPSVAPACEWTPSEQSAFLLDLALDGVAAQAEEALDKAANAAEKSRQFLGAKAAALLAVSAEDGALLLYPLIGEAPLHSYWIPVTAYRALLQYTPAAQQAGRDVLSNRSLKEFPPEVADELRSLSAQLGVDDKAITFIPCPLSNRDEPLGALVLIFDDSASEPSAHFLGSLSRLLSRLILASMRSNARLQPLKALVDGDTEVVFNNVIDSLNEGVSCCDNEGYVLYSNPSMERITGFTLEEVRGKRVYEFWFPSDSTALPDKVREQHRRYEDRRLGKAEEYETQITRKDGEIRWLDIKASPLRDRLGRVVGSIGVITDITERKMLESQLIWSQKMEAVGRLAGSVAHDFNNLLTVISGYSNMLLKRLAPDDPNRRQIDSILAASTAACSLTQQLLTVSRRQVLQPKVLDLNDVVEQTTDMIRGLVGETVALRTDLASSLPPIYVDPGQLQQVVMNLAINARDSMPKGGTLLIKSYPLCTMLTDSAYDSQIEPGDYAVLSVSDTGEGMDEFVRSRLFEPFFTTKREGTGLGLSTVYGIVKQHGGHISVLTRRGLGSTFTIYFPRSVQAKEEKPVTAPAKALPTGKERILLVEDESSVRELIRGVLTTNGYTVVEAQHGLEALRLLGNRSEQFDLLLTDIAMPHMNGIELADKVGELFPELRILSMSGCTHDSTIPDNIRKRALPFLAKPFTPDGLLEMVRETLDVNIGSKEAAIA